MFWVIMLAMALSFGSCKKESTKILSSSKMEQILYDYHVAEAMSAESDVDSVKARSYLLSVFKKHGVTEAEFDSSMVYYLRHAYELNGIYENLSERINNEAQLQGVENTTIVSNDVNADTANIWTQERARIFFTHVPFNLMKFIYKADSTFKAGDHFSLQFKADFLYQDGARNGYAVMSMKLSNDSVITRSVSMSSNAKYSVDVTDTEGLGIKELRGFIMQRYGNYETERNSSTLKLMHLYDIALIKMHDPKINEKIKEKNKEKDEKTDSIKPLASDSAVLSKPSMH